MLALDDAPVPAGAAKAAQKKIIGGTKASARGSPVGVADMLENKTKKSTHRETRTI